MASRAPRSPTSHPAQQLHTITRDWLHWHVERQDGVLLDRVALHQRYTAYMEAVGVTPLNPADLGKRVHAEFETPDFPLLSVRRGSRGDTRRVYVGIGFRANAPPAAVPPRQPPPAAAPPPQLPPVAAPSLLSAPATARSAQPLSSVAATHPAPQSATVLQPMPAPTLPLQPPAPPQLIQLPPGTPSFEIGRAHV